LLATFGIQGKSQIVGGKVTKGKAVRGAAVDIIRDGEILGSGKLSQLQQAKADVKEVIEGNECGIRFEPGDPVVEIQVGDTMEFFEEEKIKQEL